MLIRERIATLPEVVLANNDGKARDIFFAAVTARGRRKSCAGLCSNGTNTR